MANTFLGWTVLPLDPGRFLEIRSRASDESLRVWAEADCEVLLDCGPDWAYRLCETSRGERPRGLRLKLSFGVVAGVSAPAAELLFTPDRSVGFVFDGPREIFRIRRVKPAALLN